MFAALSDMFSGGEDLAGWSRTVAAMMGGGSLYAPTKSSPRFVELEREVLNRNVLSRIHPMTIKACFRRSRDLQEDTTTSLASTETENRGNDCEPDGTDRL